MKIQLKKLKRVGVLSAAFVMFASFLITTFGSQVVQAQDSPAAPRFIDRLYVQYDGDTWGNPNPYNEHDPTTGLTENGFTYLRNWKWQDGLDAAADILSGETCNDIMRVTDLNGSPKATVTFREENDFGDGCNTVRTVRDLGMDGTGRKFINAYRQDADTIYAPAGVSDDTGCHATPSSFLALIPTGTTFRDSDEDDRSNRYYKITASGVRTDQVWLDTEGGVDANIFVQGRRGCPGGRHEIQFQQVVLANNGEAVTGQAGNCIPRIENPPTNACPSDDPSDPTTGGNGGGAGTDVTSCEESNSGIILSWFLCAVINFLDNTVQTLTNIVDDLLQVNKSYYTDSDLQEAWSYFRNIASFLLIIIGLVMIIGQAITKG